MRVPALPLRECARPKTEFGNYFADAFRVVTVPGAAIVHEA